MTTRGASRLRNELRAECALLDLINLLLPLELLNLLHLTSVTLREHMTVSLTRHLAARCWRAVIDHRFECVLASIISAYFFVFLIHSGLSLHLLAVRQQLVELTYHSGLMLLVIAVTQLEDTILEVIQLGRLLRIDRAPLLG